MPLVTRIKHGGELVATEIGQDDPAAAVRINDTMDRFVKRHESAQACIGRKNRVLNFLPFKNLRHGAAKLLHYGHWDRSIHHSFFSLG